MIREWELERFLPRFLLVLSIWLSFIRDRVPWTCVVGRECMVWRGGDGLGLGGPGGQAVVPILMLHCASDAENEPCEMLGPMGGSGDLGSCYQEKGCVVP